MYSEAEGFDVSTGRVDEFFTFFYRAQLAKSPSGVWSALWCIFLCSHMLILMSMAMLCYVCLHESAARVDTGCIDL